MNKRIYSMNYGVTTPADMANYVSVTFRLPNVGIERRLKQMIWTMQLFELGSNNPIPLEQNTTFLHYLHVWNEGSNIANNVDVMAVAAPFTGTQMLFYKPGKYNFDSLATVDGMRFTFQYRNRETVSQIRFENSFLIETDEQAL